MKELEHNWEERHKQKPADLDIQYIYETIRSMAEDEERMKVLYLYTGGQPVRLSLYTDLIVNGQVIPEGLNETFAEAQTRIAEKGVEQARYEIEDDFVKPLFMGQSITSTILQVLVRAQRGVSAEQLLWVLDSAPGGGIADWKPSSDRLEEIQEAVQKLRQLSIVKPALGGGISLQDEIYRIYSHHTSSSAGNRKDERIARSTPLRKLKEWAAFEHGKLEVVRRDWQTTDEQQIKVTDFAQALNVRFPDLPLDEREERVQIYQRMVVLAVEEVYTPCSSTPSTP